MCGRYAACQHHQHYAQHFRNAVLDRQNVERVRQTYNAEPSTTRLVAVNWDGEMGRNAHLAASSDTSEDAAEPNKKLLLTAMSWGIDQQFGQGKAPHKLINARIETVLEKPTFRRLMQVSRCVCIADGYYEWKKPESSTSTSGGPGGLGKTKVPYYITLQELESIDRERQRKRKKPRSEDEHAHKESEGEAQPPAPPPMIFAGLYMKNSTSSSSSVPGSFVILTQPAIDEIAHIHDRMPVILTSEMDIMKWCDVETVNGADALEMVRTRESRAKATEWIGFKSVRVGSHVSKVGNDGVECVREISDSELALATKGKGKRSRTGDFKVKNRPPSPSHTRGENTQTLMDSFLKLKKT